MKICAADIPCVAKADIAFFCVKTGYEASINSDAQPPGSPPLAGTAAGVTAAAGTAMVGMDFPRDSLSPLARAAALSASDAASVEFAGRHHRQTLPSRLWSSYNYISIVKISIISTFFSYFTIWNFAEAQRVEGCRRGITVLVQTKAK